MIREFDTVILKKDLPEYGLKAEASGCVVEIYKGGEGYEVEFFDSEGETMALVTLLSGDVRAGESETGLATPRQFLKQA